jgi:hypothetical protein
MRISIVGLVMVVQLLGGCSKVECQSPGECGGNPCCWSVNGPDDEGTRCRATPDARTPGGGIDSFVTRACVSDEDCTAGGISTEFVRCCSLSEHPFKACGRNCS